MKVLITWKISKVSFHNDIHNENEVLHNKVNHNKDVIKGNSMENLKNGNCSE